MDMTYIGLFGALGVCSLAHLLAQKGKSDEKQCWCIRVTGRSGRIGRARQCRSPKVQRYPKPSSGRETLENSMIKKSVMQTVLSVQDNYNKMRVRMRPHSLRHWRKDGLYGTPG